MSSLIKAMKYRACAYSSRQREAGSPRGRASHRGAECTGCFLWEARPRGEAFWHGAVRREVAPPTGSDCTGCFLWEACPPGRSFSGTESASFAARSRLPQVRSAPAAFLWEARPRGEAFWHGAVPVRREVAPPTGFGVAAIAFVGGPPSGRSFLTGPAYGPVSIQTVFQGPLAGPTTTNEVNHVRIRASRFRWPRAGGLLP